MCDVWKSKLSATIYFLFWVKIWRFEASMTLWGNTKNICKICEKLGHTSGRFLNLIIFTCLQFITHSAPLIFPLDYKNWFSNKSCNAEAHFLFTVWLYNLILRWKWWHNHNFFKKQVRSKWKFCLMYQILVIRPKFWGSCAFLKNFHPRNLSEITVFYAIVNLYYYDFQSGKWQENGLNQLWFPSRIGLFFKKKNTVDGKILMENGFYLVIQK